jgi:hypothetical protein
MDVPSQIAVKIIRRVLDSPIEKDRVALYPKILRTKIKTRFDELRLREFTMYFTMNGPGEQLTRARRNEGLWCDMLCTYSGEFSESVEGLKNIHADYWFTAASEYDDSFFPIQHKCIGHRKKPIARDKEVMLAVNWSKNPTGTSSDFEIKANVLLNWWTPTNKEYHKYPNGVYLIPKEIVNLHLRTQSKSETHNKSNTAFYGDVISKWMDYCLANDLAILYEGDIQSNDAETCRVSDWKSIIYLDGGSDDQQSLDDY